MTTDTEIELHKEKLAERTILDGIYKHVKIDTQAVRKVLLGFANGLSIKQTCDKERQKNPDFPPASTIYKYIIKSKRIKELIKQGRDVYFLALLDQLQDIVNEEPDDELFEMEDKLRISAFQNKQRLRVDTVKFLVAKVAPKISQVFRSVEEKKYDDFTESGGKIDLNTPKTQITFSQSIINNEQHRKRIEAIYGLSNEECVN